MKTAENERRQLRSRSRPLFGLLILALGLAGISFVAATPASAQPVTLDVGDGAGTVGDTVIVPITVDDLTGLGIFSYEIEISWTANRATVTGAPELGTIAAAWGPVTVNSASGSLRIVAAGATPLAGSGTLINLEFLLGPNSGFTTLTVQSVLFNEGSPSAVTTNGSLTPSALPTISVSPNSGEIIVGEAIVFSTFGGTPPYTYTSSDPLIAAFTGDTLTGLSPGSVSVSSEDLDGITDQISGFIDIRALRLSAGAGAGFSGDVVSVPMLITDPSPYDLRSAEFTLSYTASRMAAVGVSTVGTVAETAGWSAPVLNSGSGTATVSMAGANPLASAGTLVFVEFVLLSQTTVSVTITPSNALFNEVFPAAPASGVVSITGLPNLTISPDLPALVVGDTQQFNLSGGPNLPVSWGVTNPGVATIDAAGLLDAIAAGQTRVWAVDALGATDTTSTFAICDLYVNVLPTTLVLTPPKPVLVFADRDVSGMGIFGFEMTISYDPNRIVIDNITSVGSLSQSWGQPVVNLNTPGQAIIVHAGASPLVGMGALVILEMIGTPASLGTTSVVTITSLLFNEGDPCALLNAGTMNISTAAPQPRGRLLELEQNFPNPFNPSTEIAYTLGRPSWARLRVYDTAGTLVRTLVDRQHDGVGRFVVHWDGRDQQGQRLASGMYLYRLDSADQVEVRKLLLLK